MLNGIDKIFCINITTSTDRKEKFTKNFPELVESPQFEWFFVERDDNNSERGCYTSHLRVLELAKKRNYNKIITFEDDCSLLVPWTKFVTTINSIKYPIDWEIIQLGYFPFVTKRVKDNNTVIKISCSGGAYSYISNVNKLVIPEYKGIQIDVLLFCPDKGKNYFLNESLPGIYGIYPKMLIRTMSTKSTINSSHDLTGQLVYDRDIVLEISTKMNLTLFVITMLILIVLAISISIGVHFSKAS